MRKELLVSAKNIKYYRKCKRMTAIELAKLVGVTRQSISAYEKGIQFPTGDKMKKIADALGVTTEDLIVIGDKP